MKLTLDLQFKLGSIVYHRIAPDTKGMVTGYAIRPIGTLYCVVWSDDVGEERHHYAIELTDSPEYLNQPDE